MQLPLTLPVMVLPECNLLPHSLLPLYIFEPRYRAMLKTALDTDRMFCVAMRKPGLADGEGEPDDVFQESTAGLIRACIKRDDGTSHLILQGVHRVKFTGWEQLRPFRIASVTPIVATGGDSDDIHEIAEEVKALVLEKGNANEQENPSTPLSQHLLEIEDPEVFADVVAYQFVSDPLVRQHLIATDNVLLRLQLVADYLERSGKPS